MIRAIIAIRKTFVVDISQLFQNLLSENLYYCTLHSRRYSDKSAHSFDTNIFCEAKFYSNYTSLLFVYMQYNGRAGLAVDNWAPGPRIQLFWSNIIYAEKGTKRGSLFFFCLTDIMNFVCRLTYFFHFFIPIFLFLYQWIKISLRLFLTYIRKKTGLVGLENDNFSNLQ